jgi:hypothetical protein
MIVGKRNKSGELRFGQWAGNPKGIAERKTDCIAEVHDSPSFLFYQCSRKRGHGPNGEFCKQHAKKLAR